MLQGLPSHLVQVEEALLSGGGGAVDSHNWHLLHRRPSQLRPTGVHPW